MSDSDFCTGNSVGAYHIANLALNKPERVKSMTLIGPVEIIPGENHIIAASQADLTNDAILRFLER